VQVTTHGVLTRTVRDSALYYAEVEKRFRNPRLDPVGHVISPPTRRLRVAAIIDSPTGVRSTP
jgi:amidase